MTLVVDASVVVASLVDSGADGTWADNLLSDGWLVAPHLMPVEAGNVLRKAARADLISEDAATLAHRDLTRLRITLAPYEPLAERIWALRQDLTLYDAWYVALAEALDAPLATLDQRLTRVSAPTCEFLTPQ